MPSLPEHLARVHEASVHQVQAGLEAGPAHGLCRPVFYRGRWWVWCLGADCEWIVSSDRERDLPTVCEVEQLATAFEADVTRAIGRARRERRELQKLTRRSA